VTLEKALQRCENGCEKWTRLRFLAKIAAAKELRDMLLQEIFRTTCVATKMRDKSQGKLPGVNIGLTTRSTKGKLC